ncbi:MAG: ribosome small subunit-dependent GTPase A [Clostridia bacterium]|nr:ribosome small subunit-dependent GTPase A [Clostridia bacterium]
MQKKGIIISNISNMYMVEDCDSNNIIKCNARGKFKEKNITPTVGDYVDFCIIDETKNEGVIDDILDRKNYIKRPKISNLTQIIFVVSMKMPKPDLLMLDKQLAFAEFNNVKPLICFNKIDLVQNEAISQIEKIYTQIGYEVINTNAKDKIGIDELKNKLKNNITAFSGNSGVGKSTLINSIFSNDITKEGSISQKNKKGKNTTTNTFLYKIDESSYIADTPGFSTFDISEIKSEELYKYFIEFKDCACNCEFVGCTHIKEKNCGIKDAIILGKISEERYNRFCKIYLEIKDKEAHKW